MTPGTVLAGRYRLGEIVGAGGMGRVWRGRDLMLRREVAVKEILPTAEAGGLDRFDRREQTLREARAGARLQHPNVVAILDVLHTDRPWIVMEYVPSRSLHQLVTADGPLAPREAARIGLRLLAALSAAHGAGIIHRDVKPHNVLIGDDGRVVLTDFGLAVLDDGGGVTRADLVVGSPHYVAPERAGEGASTVASDLWSLGATLYMAVEGRAPYQRPTVMGTLTALAIAPPDPPRRAGPLTPALVGLLDREPGRRPDAETLRRHLEGVVDGRPYRPTTGATRRRRAGIAATAAVLAVTAGGAAFAMGRGSERPAALAAAPAPSHPCLAGPAPANRTPVAAADPGGPYALPAGWVWHRDPAGFTVGAPGGWDRYVDAGAVCFRDPDNPRALAVEPAVTPTRTRPRSGVAGRRSC